MAQGMAFVSEWRIYVRLYDGKDYYRDEFKVGWKILADFDEYSEMLLSKYEELGKSFQKIELIGFIPSNRCWLEFHQ
ncbi:MAG: hypothetical protein AAB597_03015 [Patescibacteria group bacterium]